MSERSQVRKPRLCLIRHGQASLGTADYDRLSVMGQRQSRQLGRRLVEHYGSDWQAWSGSLRRHRQTMAELAPSREGRIEPALNEYTVDQLIRSAVAQAEALDLRLPAADAFADPKAYLMTFLEWFPEVLTVWQQGRLNCQHNGLWLDFRQRVLDPVDEWTRVLKSGHSAVVVTSAGVISTITAELLGQDLAWQRELNVALYNASVTELVPDDEGGWQAVTINCVDHLDATDLHTLA
jgi:broad specificity phosphatase PhoE